MNKRLKHKKAGNMIPGLFGCPVYHAGFYIKSKKYRRKNNACGHG
jgi:hypothetical protein